MKRRLKTADLKLIDMSENHFQKGTIFLKLFIVILKIKNYSVVKWLSSIITII